MGASLARVSGPDRVTPRHGSDAAMIIRIVADAFDIPPREMHSKRRDPPRPLARHVAMWLIRQMTPHSYPAIGRAFGGLDHTSVMYGVSRVKWLIARDVKLAELIGRLESHIEEIRAS
jgi:chromosomal replication initiator protein